MALVSSFYNQGLALWAWLHSTSGASLLMALWLLSEVLGENKAIAQNSVYGLFKSGLKWLKDKVSPQASS